MHATVSGSRPRGSCTRHTTFGYDQRGLQLWTVTPRGNAAGADPAAYRTDTVYDQVGKVVTVTAPPVSVEEAGGTAVTARPVTRNGFNTFGDQAGLVDTRGNLTRRSYDRLGRLTRVDHPAYTPPAGGATQNPYETFAYDKVGNQTSSRDRRGNVTDYRFDARNRVVQRTDPLVDGQATRGVWQTTWDDAGNQSGQVTPTGASTTTGYDDLGRARSRTSVVRQQGGGAFTTLFGHDDLGNQTWQRDPVGLTATTVYDAASQPFAATDQAGKTTTFTWDAAGRRTAETDPLGRRLEHSFDQAGRETSTTQRAADGTLLSRTWADYDPDSNLAVSRSARSSGPTDATYASTATFDALGRLTSVTEPGTPAATTSYGYDAAGNLTRLTDGNGHATTYTWTPWNTPASTIEPPTPGQTNQADARKRSHEIAMIANPGTIISLLLRKPEE